MLSLGTYNLIGQRGGQKIVPLVATTLVKVKGFATYSNGSQTPEVWDATDVVHPALEDGGTFVTTSFYRWEQMRENCSGLISCVSHNDCPLSALPVASGGIPTGVCNAQGYCEVNSWCPIERDPEPEPPNELQGISDFTIFIRHFVGFPSVNDGFDTGTELKPQWNLFSISNLLKATEIDYNSIKQSGTVIVMNYDYKCYFDFKNADDCKSKPKITIVQLGAGKNAAQTTSFNFRKEDIFRTYNPLTGESPITRLLQKQFGIRYARLSNLHFLNTEPIKTNSFFVF